MPASLRGWHASQELLPGGAFCASAAGKGAGWKQQGQEVWSTWGKGGGNKRQEEGALNSINLQKEAAVRRGN